MTLQESIEFAYNVKRGVLRRLKTVAPLGVIVMMSALLLLSCYPNQEALQYQQKIGYPFKIQNPTVQLAPDTSPEISFTILAGIEGVLIEAWVDFSALNGNALRPEINRLYNTAGGLVTSVVMELSLEPGETSPVIVRLHGYYGFTDIILEVVGFRIRDEEYKECLEHALECQMIAIEFR